MENNLEETGKIVGANWGEGSDPVDLPLLPECLLVPVKHDASSVAHLIFEDGTVLYSSNVPILTAVINQAIEFRDTLRERVCQETVTDEYGFETLNLHEGEISKERFCEMVSAFFFGLLEKVRGRLLKKERYDLESVLCFMTDPSLDLSLKDANHVSEVGKHAPDFEAFLNEYRAMVLN